MLALLTFRDEMRFLPGFFENVVSQVDGIVALDDRSVDGSREFVAAQPGVVDLLTAPEGTELEWNDAGNHRVLVEAAWSHGPDWLIAVDADERLERRFRERADETIAWAEREGHSAFWVKVRELWDRPDAYRVDGVWGAKRSARLFKARTDHLFEDRLFHGQWAPLNDYPANDFPTADLVIYHLRMMRAADRRARQAKYERLDPDNTWQEIGYAYMTQEEGLLLEELPPGRGYEPLGR